MLDKIEIILKQMMEEYKAYAIDSLKVAKKANRHAETFNIKGQTVEEIWGRIKDVEDAPEEPTNETEE